MDARSSFCLRITCCEDDVVVVDVLLVERDDLDAPDFFLDLLDDSNEVW